MKDSTPVDRVRTSAPAPRPIVFVELFICSNAAVAKELRASTSPLPPTRRDGTGGIGNQQHTQYAIAQHSALPCSLMWCPLPVRFLPSVPPCVSSSSKARRLANVAAGRLCSTDCSLRHPVSRPAWLRPRTTHTRRSVSSLRTSFLLGCPSSSVRPSACPTVPLLPVPVPFGFSPTRAALLCVPAAWRGVAWHSARGARHRSNKHEEHGTAVLTENCSLYRLPRTSCPPFPRRPGLALASQSFV
jgi:hypothetical protein